MIYKPFGVVVVPFPFTHIAKHKKRPALVMSTEAFQKENGHVALLMITSAKHSAWFGDFCIRDLQETGLSVASYVRQKIFTIDSRLVEKQIGCLSQKDISGVKKHCAQCLVV